ncbi:MAG: hypothetical protein IJK02_10640 [Clostridia bacterium]|nr:hypothetical protein [Clostridia bacterium]
MKEINFNEKTLMKGGYPQIRKLGAVSPCGESTPFVFGGRLYRLELEDPTRGTDPAFPACALIRDRETGEVLSRFGQGCYYYSLYQENGTVFVIGTLRAAGDTLILFESRDLVNWQSRELLKAPGWRFFNTSLTKGPQGYVLCIEASEPAEYVGVPFTAFFSFSPNLVHWTPPDPEKGFPRHRYLGGPWLRYSRGWYYLIAVTEMPCYRFTNYIYRTEDFDTWEVGLYNPILMPDEEDRKISPYACDLSPELLREIRTGFIASNSDVDLCEWNGKTLITYNAGNQLGFYYLCEARYDGSPDDFLAAYFE